MKRLVAFGCSLTYGEYLENIHQDSWPSQLGKLLDIDVMNISRPGASNKEILYNILNFEFQEGDICVILWTNIFRWTIFDEEEMISLGIWQDSKQAKAFFKYFWNTNDMQLDLIEKSNHADLRLKKINIPVYHTVSSLGNIAKQNKLNLNWSHNKWLPIDFERIRQQNPKASDNSHPGPEAYKKFAKELYHEIRKQ